MSHEALIIDDDPHIHEIVADILDSLGHRYDQAWSQEEARQQMAAKRYSYYLLDLEIPVRSGRISRVQNGENLLKEIVATHEPGPAPVLVMTGHSSSGAPLAVRMMKLGARDYITKPFDTGNALDKAILELLDGTKRRKPAAKDRPCEAPVAFEGGELVFFEDRVELCGAVVVAGHCRIRRILDELRATQPRTGKYVAYSGAKLAAKLKVTGGQNAIAEAVKNLRDEVAEILMAQGIECGRMDIIRSGGAGYRLAESIRVRGGDSGVS